MQAQKSVETAAIELPEIGQPFQGGFYVGKINIAGQIAAIIVASKEHQFVGLWGEYGKKVEGARSTFDCYTNTLAMAEAGSESAKKVIGLNIGGFGDWAIPSRDALELMYRNLKPTEQKNYCSWRDGDNPSSVPPGHLYSEESPAMTTSSAFHEGGEQAFDDKYYWTSTQYSACLAYCQGFDDGIQDSGGKLNDFRVRPVRRLFI